MQGNDSIYDSSKVVRRNGTVLEGRRVLFLGSSVTFGAASLEDGIPEYFRQRLGCVITKEAVSGTTLVDEDETSYVSRLKSNVDVNTEYSLVVCQLSTNDATRDKELGAISDSYELADFDVKTITGAMEYIIAYCKSHWGCPVMFYTGSFFDSKNYQAMVDRLFELADKWKIGVLDLWTDDDFNSISDTDRELYLADPIHPTKAGYMKWWCPEMERQLLKFL